jgi:hypothetical protein
VVVFLWLIRGECMVKRGEFVDTFAAEKYATVFNFISTGP